MLLTYIHCVVVVITILLARTSSNRISDEFVKSFSKTKLNFENELNVFADDLLKFSAIQDLYTNISVQSHPIDIDELLRNVSIPIQTRLAKSAEILKKNVEIVSKHGSPAADASRLSHFCCDSKHLGLIAESRFKSDVFMGVCQGQNDFFSLLDSPLELAFGNNLLEADFLLWQYYGSVGGHYVQFPYDSSSCDDHSTIIDHRIRLEYKCFFNNWLIFFIFFLNIYLFSQNIYTF